MGVLTSLDRKQLLEHVSSLSLNDIGKDRTGKYPMIRDVYYRSSSKVHTVTKGVQRLSQVTRVGDKISITFLTLNVYTKDR